MSSNLTIYKASAGSGKTFRLAVEYLKLLINNPTEYRNTLAVTFTNKATAEMKFRIMSELYGISHKLNDSANYLKIICDETGKSEREIVETAGVALKILLHDYSRFTVETIDSFFQVVLRNMAKELGLTTNFTVNIDDDDVQQNAVAQTIEQAHENKYLLQLLTDYVAEKLENNRSWRIDGDIENFCKSIINEAFKALPIQTLNKLVDKKFSAEYKKKLYSIKQSEETKMKNYAAQFFKILDQNNLIVDDFLYGKSGVCGYFIKLDNADFAYEKADIFKGRTLDASENSAKWVTKQSPKFNQIIALADGKLIPLLNAAETCRETAARLYNSCNLIIENINNLGILSDVQLNIRKLNDDENQFALSDTSVLLARMIGDNDTSFIFEKIGATIKHIMIDEFQDTSQMQWENFKLLLLECLSQGNNSLIVGDVKQAIYRWRNGNWQILNNIQNEKLLSNFNPQIETLQNSWRSAKNIIKFNNNLFTKAAEILDGECLNAFSEKFADLELAYKDVEQKGVRNDEGSVLVDFCEATSGEKYETEMLQKLAENVESMQAAGIKASNIAILVRKKKHIAAIADFFAKRKAEKSDGNCCYDLVSDESFTLGSSTAVSAVIDALRYVESAQNCIALANLAIIYQQKVLKNNVETSQILLNVEKFLPADFLNNIEAFKLMPLYELIEKIYSTFNIEKLGENGEYMFTFLDKTNEYLSRESSDIANFLNYFDDKLFGATISSSGSAVGIKIMTIHKSKGLEFDSVIVPFCDWNLGAESGKTSYVWCSPKEAPFAEIATMPVKYSPAMHNSVFADDYKRETLQMWIDNLNLLYVALTRAENNLIIIGKTDNSTKTVSGLMFNALGMKNYSDGNVFISKEKQKTSTENKFKITPKPLCVPFVSHSYNFEFKQSNRSREFIKTGDIEPPVNVYIDRGKLLHKLFSEIATPADVDKSLLSLQTEGLIQEQDKTELKHFVVEAITQTQVQQWYSGKYKLFNECSIITQNDAGNVIAKRPDRVMIDGENAIVIDFKFGKAHKIYNAQVAEYMSLLKNMNYKNVSGFLWYVDDNRIEQIQ